VLELPQRCARPAGPELSGDGKKSFKAGMKFWEDAAQAGPWNNPLLLRPAPQIRELQPGLLHRSRSRQLERNGVERR
jgi:hypothetical protein